MFNYVASTNYGLKEHDLCQTLLRKTMGADWTRVIGHM